MEEARKLKTLIVEDCDDDVALVLRALHRHGFHVVHERVQTADDFSAALSRRQWDIVLSDFNMPGFCGADALRILREHDKDTPFFLVSGTIGEEKAVDIIKSGANDYVMKQNLTRLGIAVERELR